MTTTRDETPAEKSGKAPSIARGVGWLALNIFVPASEARSVTRHAGRNVTRLWQRIREVTAGRAAGDYSPADWTQAVADSGLPAERLSRNLRVSRWIWWALMWLTGLPALGFLLMLLAAGSSVSGTAWLRVGCVLLVLAMLAATGFVQVLALNYRLWQLSEKRVSASEAGSFRDYLGENKWCRQVLGGGLNRRINKNEK